MWVVAQNAYAHLHRLMDEALRGETVVASVTQFRVVAASFELVLGTGLKGSGVLFGFMTSVALVL